MWGCIYDMCLCTFFFERVYMPKNTCLGQRVTCHLVGDGVSLLFFCYICQGSRRVSFMDSPVSPSSPQEHWLQLNVTKPRSHEFWRFELRSLGLQSQSFTHFQACMNLLTETRDKTIIFHIHSQVTFIRVLYFFKWIQPWWTSLGHLVERSAS